MFLFLKFFQTFFPKLSTFYFFLSSSCFFRCHNVLLHFTKDDQSLDPFTLDNFGVISPSPPNFYSIMTYTHITASKGKSLHLSLILRRRMVLFVSLFWFSKLVPLGFSPCHFKICLYLSILIFPSYWNLAVMNLFRKRKTNPKLLTIFLLLFYILDSFLIYH